MVKEFAVHPPDIGSIVNHDCGCVTWTSGGEFIVAACASNCPTVAEILKVSREESVPAEFRWGWSR